MPEQRPTVVIRSADELVAPRSRREFLRLAALGGTAVLAPSMFAACGDDDPVAPGVPNAELDLSTGPGVLNYLFALEQVEAEFYVRVVQESTAAGFNALQRRLLADIRNHEFIHREALRALLGAAHLPELRIGRSFNRTDFRSRQSILTTAMTLEDLTVAAYNNAGQYLTDVNDLLLAGKIVSVEARHSAIIRGMLDSLVDAGTGLRFAGDDVVDDNGFDSKGQPATATAVIAAVTPYVDVDLSLTGQPA